MCGKSGGRNQSRGGAGGKEGVGRQEHLYPPRQVVLVFRAHTDSNIIYQTCLCIMHTKKHIHKTTTTTTTTNYTQPCSLSHWTQQVSLSLSQYLSLSLSLFEPSTNSSLRTCTPSYRTTLPLNLVFLSSLIYSYFHPSPRRLQDNTGINWLSWPTLLINSSHWGSMPFFLCRRGRVEIAIAQTWDINTDWSERKLVLAEITESLNEMFGATCAQPLISQWCKYNLIIWSGNSRPENSQLRPSWEKLKNLLPAGARRRMEEGRPEVNNWFAALQPKKKKCYFRI